MIRSKFSVALLGLMLVMPAMAKAEVFRDVLDTPARMSPLAAKAQLTAVAMAGKRLVAVGQRGHVVYSDDVGTTWTQAAVPVSSDLVAVAFPSARQGWAVGHDGVVLHTDDGGAHWKKQLDGRKTGQILVDYYRGSANVEAAFESEIKRVAEQGAENSFLDVWFQDDKNGFVIGAFNQIFHTSDGGQNWEPWYHRTDNPNRLHLYAIRAIGKALYVVGEQGLMLKLDGEGKRFVSVDTGYKGTYFGVMGEGHVVLAFGLRGNVLRSSDEGKHWQRVEVNSAEGMTGGDTCHGDNWLLVTQSGRVLASKDQGEHFAPLKQDQTMPAAAIKCVESRAFAVAGVRGVRVQSAN